MGQQWLRTRAVGGKDVVGGGGPIIKVVYMTYNILKLGETHLKQVFGYGWVGWVGGGGRK